MVNNQTQNIIVPGIVSSMSTIHGQFRQDAQIKVIQKRDWQHMREKSIRDIFISNQSKEGTISSGATQEAFMFQKEGKLQNTLKQSTIDSNFYSNFMHDKKKTKVEKRYVYEDLKTLRSKRGSMPLSGSREVEMANMMMVLSQLKHKQRQPRIAKQDLDLEPYINRKSNLSDIGRAINDATLYQTVNDQQQPNRFLQRQGEVNKQTFEMKSKSVFQLPKPREDILNSQSIFKFSRNPELNSRITEDSLYQESPNVSLNKTKMKSVVPVSESFQASYKDLKMYTQKSSIQDLTLKVPNNDSPGTKGKSQARGLLHQRSQQKIENERREVQDSNNILIRKYSDANMNEKHVLKGLNDITKKQYLDENPNLKPFTKPDFSPYKVKQHIKNFEIIRKQNSQQNKISPDVSLFRTKSVHKDEFLDYKCQSSTQKINKKIEELWNEIIQFKEFKFFYPAPQDAGIQVKKSALSKYVNIDSIYPEKKQIDFIKVQLQLIDKIRTSERGTHDKMDEIDNYREEVKKRGDSEVLDILDKFIFENFERLLKGDVLTTLHSKQSQPSSSESEKSNYFDQDNDDVVEKLSKKDFDYFVEDFQHKARRHQIIEEYHKDAALRRDGYSDMTQVKLDELNQSTFASNFGDSTSKRKIVKNEYKLPESQVDKFNDNFKLKYLKLHDEIKDQKLNERFQIIKVTERILKKKGQNTAILNSLKESLKNN